jgi:hypothetical protein
MPSTTDLRYAYELTNKVIKTLEKLNNKLTPYKSNKTRRRRRKRKNYTRKN